MKSPRQTVRASHRTIVWAALFTIALATPCVTTAQNNSPPSAEQQQLIQAQTENYKAQTAKLNEKQSWWEKLLSYGGSLAVLVAVVSLILNYSSTLRTQRDAQFLEALKRFGDKDSPSIRSSAAGLLAKLAGQRAIFLRWRRPNFHIVLDQLMTGFLLEENPVCVSSIIDAVRQVTTYSSLTVLKESCVANLRVQRDMVKVLAKFFATAFPNEEAPLATSNFWKGAASSTPYPPMALVTLSYRHREDFLREHKSAIEESKAMNEVTREAVLVDTRRDLSLISNRLMLNVQLCSEVIKSVGSSWRQSTAGLNLKDLFLFNADFYLASLTGCDFSSSQLQGTNFEKAKLQSAHFSSAKLQLATFMHAHLEGADFAHAQLEGATLAFAKLQSANLSSANLGLLELKNFGGADTSKPTSVAHANLEGANLNFANLQGINSEGSPSFTVAESKRVKLR